MKSLRVKLFGELDLNFRNWQISNAKASCQVDRSRFQEANWRSRREKLDFYDFPFWMIHYQLVIEDTESGRENFGEVVERGEVGGEKGGGGGQNYRDEEGDADKSQDKIGDEEEGQVGVDMLSSNADFTNGGPPGAACWGLREMIVIQPAGEEILGNDTRARMVVGAVNIALHNTGCPVACLVQVNIPKRGCLEFIHQ